MTEVETAVANYGKTRHKWHQKSEKRGNWDTTKQKITQKEKVEHWDYNKHILTKHTNWKDWGNKKKVKI